jgi:hypothetical protein
MWEDSSSEIYLDDILVRLRAIDAVVMALARLMLLWRASGRLAGYDAQARCRAALRTTNWQHSGVLPEGPEWRILRACRLHS